MFTLHPVDLDELIGNVFFAEDRGDTASAGRYTDTVELEDHSRVFNGVGEGAGSDGDIR